MTTSPTAAERNKLDSRRLRGGLLDSLADPVTGALHDGDELLVKYHGCYQQDDRDLREERRLARLEPAYSFMVRTRTPGGVLTPAQWLRLDEVATTHAARGLRITTRQALQFHGVIKTRLKATLQAINAALVDTIAACGDVNRNIVVASNPHLSHAHARVHAQAAALSAHLAPRTRAYHEIWLDEERVAGSGEEEEPIYGASYLPRKFKIGFAIPPDNDIDVFAQDLGFIAVFDRGQLLGYDVYAGGGMGVTHGHAGTYPRLASSLGFATPAQVVAVAEAVIGTQRDHGNRVDRKQARLKYTIDANGLDWFKAEVERRAGFAFAPARPFLFTGNGDRFGWVDGHDGRAHLALRIPAGRLVDGRLDGRGDDVRHLSGMRALARLLQAEDDGAEFRLTPNQNLVVAGIQPQLRRRIDALVAEYGLDGYRGASPLRQRALACVALPTCGLAMAEAERYLPDLVDAVEGLLARHGIADAPIHLRVSGCPNGCSRPYLGEIALVGKAPGRYNLMLGADHRGQRLSTLYRENIDEAAILAALDPLLAAYARERRPGEGFGDHLVRSGAVAIPAAGLQAAGAAAPTELPA